MEQKRYEVIAAKLREMTPEYGPEVVQFFDQAMQQAIGEEKKKKNEG